MRNQRLRSGDGDWTWLLPPSLHDSAPSSHPAHPVREALDLAAILGAYDGTRGQPPYPAALRTALLYASSCGVYSSRRSTRGCAERLDCLAVSGLPRPDCRNISACRQRPLQVLGGLCDQVLRLGREAGWARLGPRARDGTHIQAHASQRKALSSGRMVAAEAAWATETAAGLERAAQADAAEDGAQGAARRGAEMPS